MGILDRFETSLDKMVNGAFAKAFKADVQPVEIAAAVQKEMDERAAVVTRSRTVVPNEYFVHLSDSDYERLATYAEVLSDELAELAREYAQEQRYTFLGPVVVTLTEEERLATGVFRVSSQATAATANTVGRAGTGRSLHPRLLAAGQEIVLPGPTTCLGRGNDVDIRLEDPGVSRRHAEISFADGVATITDLGSTNGTLVDGVRVGSQPLDDGSVIRLGSTDITYRSS